MKDNAIDRLIEKIKETKNPTVMGLDPRYEMLPNCLTEKYPKTLEGVSQAIIEYNKALIDATYDIIPAIKPQVAFYEMFGIPGMKALEETCSYAKEKGMIIIADAKRGDIGSTAAGYSNAYLGKTKIGDIEKSIFDIDFLTVNPYMGTDCVKPFVEDCKKYGKGLFVLVKTSNPSSGELQDLKLESGEEVYTRVANLVEKWGEDLRGEYGYSSIAAVVGATYPEQLKSIRETAPHTYFLIPGYGAQGGKAEDIALGFDKEGLGGIVNASRSLMCAYKSDKWKEQFDEKDYAKATRAEAIRMRDEITSAL
ncbi:MAG: orotidine-5'-phosphate decarboxylase [Clostridia bacterium]|nr:orotidine-5'-phosphate decarboxylase [Clostridia bacterium]